MAKADTTTRLRTNSTPAAGIPNALPVEACANHVGPAIAWFALLTQHATHTDDGALVFVG